LIELVLAGPLLLPSHWVNFVADGAGIGTMNVDSLRFSPRVDETKYGLEIASLWPR
jgi:hypothetical protein